ncbi:energy transducer TonB [Roseibium sp. RKSG952]|uniref:energy transducer TonB family protein n=1 Tax=Roseibium sp. RKSG952 TaxID=2529384 RepID=UPI0012BCC371|nr:energy transducer TonB [Roseibium sp. RKSG952]MTI00173.1 TonB family protein [Roseibium sp. RKSG952]
MRLTRQVFLGAIAVSAALHFGVVALTVKQEPLLQIEGAGAVQDAVLGSSAFDTVLAGTTAATVTPEEVPEPLAAERPRQAAEAETTELIRPEAVNPVAPAAIETATPAAAVPLQKAEAALAVPLAEPAMLSPDDILREAPVQPDATIQPAEPVQSDPAELLVAKVSADKVAESANLQPQAQPSKADTSEQAEAPRPLEPQDPAENVEPAEMAEPINPAGVSAKADVTAPLETAEKPEILQPVQTVGIPRRRPPDRPLKQAGARPDPAAKTETTRPKRTAAERPAANRNAVSAASSDGQGGQGARTAKRGGSQRKGKAAQAGNSDVTNYPAKVQRKLARSVRAPRGGGGQVKDVVVAFTIAASGGVSNVRLVTSSGSTRHDEEALKAVHRAAPFPKIPEAANRRSWSFTLPVRFKRN